MRTIFRDARLLDGECGPRVASVLVEGDRIAGVAEGAVSVAEGDRVYDCAGKTLMPGMVGGHLHLTYHKLDVFDLMGSDMRYPAAYMGVAAAKNAETVLKAGFTAGVGAGGTYNIDVVLKQLIADGLAVGPRLVACGKDFCVTGHSVDYKPEIWKTAQDALGEVCDGPEEFRKAIRREAKRGVEVIKMFVEGGHGLPTGGQRMSYAEIEAAANAAHDAGIRIRAHAFSNRMIKQCLKAGVDIIDHCDQMDDEIIETVVRQGAFVLPSLYHLTLMNGITHSADDCARWFDHARGSLARAVQAGVKLCIGDDFGTLQGPHGDNARELAVYSDTIGIAPLEVLRWATANGAKLMGRDDIGRIAEGKLADLLVVDGDPLADMGVLADKEKLLIVMQGGHPFVSQMPPEPTQGKHPLKAAA